jgi:hypothetical protein
LIVLVAPRLPAPIVEVRHLAEVFNGDCGAARFGIRLIFRSRVRDYANGKRHQNEEEQCGRFCGRGLHRWRRNLAAIIELIISTHLLSPVENAYRYVRMACDDGVEYSLLSSARYYLIAECDHF